MITAMREQPQMLKTVTFGGATPSSRPPIPPAFPSPAGLAPASGETSPDPVVASGSDPVRVQERGDEDAETDEDDAEEDEYLSALVRGAQVPRRRVHRAPCADAPTERISTSNDPLAALAETLSPLRVGGGEGRASSGVVLEHAPVIAGGTDDFAAVSPPASHKLCLPLASGASI